jgi:twitching motility two-component system response regulator PilG
MSMHFISHHWEATNVDDGIMVALDGQVLDSPALAAMVDDLFELAQESGQSTVFLNFDKVQLLPSVAFGKLMVLNAKLNDVGCRLVLCGVHPHLRECLEAAGLTDILEIRESETASGNTQHSEVGIRVLLADPDESFLVSNRVFLSRHGFDVATATSGLDCLEKLREFKPDVLVLEPQMSWGQGDDILALMEQEDDVPRVPVLILSSGDDTTKPAEPTYTTHAHQAKPLMPDHLASRIRWLFECSPPPGGFFA